MNSGVSNTVGIVRAKAVLLQISKVRENTCSLVDGQRQKCMIIAFSGLSFIKMAKKKKKI